MSGKRKLTRKEKIQLQQEQAPPTPKVKPREGVPRWMLVAVFALGILLYSNTINHGYVLDDFSVIKSNWVIKQGFEGLATIFKTSYRHGYWLEQGSLYRPLTLSIFAIQWQLFPDQPWVAHLFNILMYGLLGVVLFLTLFKLFKGHSGWLAFFAVLLFTAHPTHTEVVANIKSLDEILSLLLVFGSILLLLKHIDQPNNKLLAFSLGLYFLAFLAKESAITFLAVFPLLLYYFKGRSLKQTVMPSALYLMPALMYLMIRNGVLGSVSGEKTIGKLDNFLTSAPDVLTAKVTAIKLLGMYVAKLFFPHPLVNDYSFNQIPLSSVGDPAFLLSLAFFLGLAYLAIKGFKTRNLLSFAILYFAITISLYSNLLFTIGSAFADRFLFVPSLGFCIILAIYLCKLGQLNDQSPLKLSSLMKGKPMAAAGLCALLLVSYSFKTIDRNAAWKDNFTLYETDVELSPNSARTHYYYGLGLMRERAIVTDDPAERQDYLERSIKSFERADQILPGYADANGQMGLAYYRLGNKEKAMECYLRSLEKNPYAYTTLNNLAAIYFERQQYQEALGAYHRAIQANPRYVDALTGLGSTYGTIGDFPNSLIYFKKALEYEKENARIYFYVGITYKQLGDDRSAEPFLRQAYQMDPSLRQ